MNKVLPGPESARGLWRVFQGITAIWIGLGYAIGPPFWYRSPTLFVLQELPIPIPVWGWIMTIAGILVLTPWRSFGHFLAFVTFGFWSACVAVNAVIALVSYTVFLLTGNMPDTGTPPVASWGGDALFLTVALMHAHQLLAPLAVQTAAEEEEDGP